MHSKMLYVSRAASCGGGSSMLLDGSIARGFIESTELGKNAVEILSQPLPFRVPSLFTGGGYQGEADYIWAPVFSKTIPWRWRYNTIKAGIQESDPGGAEEMLWAVEYLNRALGEAPGQLVKSMPDDTLIMVANHRALRGRTACKDGRRHVLRVRFEMAST